MGFPSVVGPDAEIWRAIPSTFDPTTHACKWYTFREESPGLFVIEYEWMPFEIMGTRYRALQILAREDPTSYYTQVGAFSVPEEPPFLAEAIGRNQFAVADIPKVTSHAYTSSKAVPLGGLLGQATRLRSQPRVGVHPRGVICGVT